MEKFTFNYSKKNDTLPNRISSLKAIKEKLEDI